MGRNLLAAYAALVLAVALSGCANQNSIFRQNIVRSATSPTVFTVDAKQRHMVVTPNLDGKGWRTCAEAAPDVFSALSTSAAADLGFGHSGTQTDAQAKAALAIAEAAGTIERTQTINLLRESMYRTCERYLSGAITPAAFAVQAGRDWRAMIGILAIEQLTRAARPSSTIIMAGSTSASVQSESDVFRQLAIAQGAEEEARIAKDNADKDEKSVCADTAEANKPACEAKKQAAIAAGEALARATHRRATWETIAQSKPQGSNSSSSTGAGTNNPGGSAEPSSTDMAKVADTVGDIVHWAFDTDETQLFCIQVMQDQSAVKTLDPDGSITSECIKYLLAKVQAERNLFTSAEVLPIRIEQGELIQATRVKVANFLEGLDDASYASERALIAAKVGPFCEGLTRNACIDAVRDGAFDPKAPRLSAAVTQRIQLRGQP